mmetsp:Transcript_37403/g.79798  ORF Transcript_37403/g.79798 Transcript_37403/m.79798 type:complete len:154 (-) Transcript_37403:2245-2706(-)
MAAAISKMLFHAPSTIGALISFFSLAGIGTVGASHLQPSPVAQNHFQRRLTQRKLRDASLPRSRHAEAAAAGEDEWNEDARRRLRLRDSHAASNATEDCPGTPFLWKISEDATGKHVGFGLGTMHLPVDVVTTDHAYSSIKAAIEGDHSYCHI